MDELDPYRDMPMSSKEDLALDAPEYSTEASGMNGSSRRQHADMAPVRTDNGLGYGGQAGHSRAGRREGAPLSAQASCLGICLFPFDSYIEYTKYVGQFGYLKADCFLRETWTAAALFGSSDYSTVTVTVVVCERAIAHSHSSVMRTRVVRSIDFNGLESVRRGHLRALLGLVADVVITFIFWRRNSSVLCGHVLGDSCPHVM